MRWPSRGGLVEHQAGGHVADAAGLLHVVGDDDDRVVVLQVVHQVFDPRRRDRVERRAGLVHQDDLGLDGQRPGDAEPLLLAAGELQARAVELVLDLVPEGGAAERALDQLVHVAPVAVDPRPPGDVVVDALGERVRLLEDHADPAAQRRPASMSGPVMSLAVEADLALHPGAGDQVVHPVEAAQQRALAAARRADQRGDLVAGDVDRDVLERQRRPVPDREAARSRARPGRPSGGAGAAASGGGGARRTRVSETLMRRRSDSGTAHGRAQPRLVTAGSGSGSRWRRRSSTAGGPAGSGSRRRRRSGTRRSGSLA